MILRTASLALALLACLTSTAVGELLLDEDEIALVLSHGPWPPDSIPDPSNRVSGNAQAIELGRALFHDPALSSDGSMSCATCHDPARGFTSPEPRAMGRERLKRNAQSLWNLQWHRWFGWGGRSDSLWSHSINPLTDPREMALDSEAAKQAIRQSKNAEQFEAVFGPLAAQSEADALVNIAKSLAAFQETLVTGQTAFDTFRDALENNDLEVAATFPKDAQRGLQIFTGRGNCSTCHTGPTFTNGEFHDAGVPYFISPTEVDAGRYEGLRALRDSPYTLDGPFTDDPQKSGAWKVQNVKFSHADFGIFRTPSLRNVALTAPYMHDGSLADLDAVIRHYNEIDLERMHTDGEAILQPLNLTDQEIRDLVAFLTTLTESED